MPNDRRLGSDLPADDDRPNGRRERSIESVMVEVLELRAQVRALQAEAQHALTVVESPADQISPTMTLEAMQARDVFIQNVINNFFKEGLHFGVPFPGAKGPDGKPVRMLYKVGAEWFAAEHAALITEVEHWRQAASASDEVLRAAALAYFQQTGDLKPIDGLEIKHWDTPDYDAVLALQWCRVNLPALLVLDTKAYEKLLREKANSQILTEVLRGMPGKVEKEARPSIAKDLTAYLPKPETEVA